MIWVINTLVYILTLFMMVSPNKGLNDLVFLGPDLRTLENWGALNAYEIRYNFQIWRLFTSLFLSIGFSEYMISSGALLVIGFMVENPKMSAARMAMFYFLSGILGNLFSVCVESELSVGSMPAVMALVSGMLGTVIVNWKALHGVGMMRICIIFMLVMLFVVILLLSAQPDALPGRFKGVSMTAEAGGFMSGLGLGMMMMPYALQRPSPYVKMIRKIGFIYTLIYCAIIIPVFFCVVEPANVWLFWK